MEIITNAVQAKTGPEGEDNGKFTASVAEAIDEVAAAEASNGSQQARQDVPAEAEKADVSSNTDGDPILSAADSNRPKYHDNTGLIDAKDVEKAYAEITQAHKDAFADSVVSGARYTESFRLLGGRLVVKVRSRSNEETDAISAYSRRKVSTGEIKVDYDYSALMRRLLAIAQVDEINGVRNPVMEKPLFYEETADGLKPPAWEKMIRVWDEKPESVLSAITKCILMFEARYWYMIQKADDENFWVPGESTGA